MPTTLLLLNGTFIAGIYALGHLVSAQGASPLGLLFWQVLSSAIVVGGVSIARGKGPPVSWPHLRFYLIAGLLGLTLPYLVTYSSLARLPAGIVGIVGSLSALFTYAIARLTGDEQPTQGRTLGIVLGLVGVLGILLPNGTLPEAGAAGWILLASLAPLSLAGGNVYRTRAWPIGLSPLSAASGMLVVQAIGLAPAAAFADAWVLPKFALERTDVALFAIAALSSAIYAASFALQQLTGPVIVGQLGYVITVASLTIGVGIFGERYSVWMWLAVAIVFGGIYLVNRRK